MIKALHIKHKSFHQKFIVAWLAFSLAFMCLVIVHQWENISSSKIREFELSSNKLGIKFNGFLDEIIEALDTLTFYNNKSNSCKTILPEIQSLQFNSVAISGITVSNPKGNIRCSTFKNNSTLPKLISTKGPTITGPVKLDSRDTEVYLLQQDLNGYNVIIYFLKTTFERILSQNMDDYNFIGLYDNQTKKIIFGLGWNFTNRELLLNHNPKNVTLKVHQDHADIVLPIHSLVNTDLVVSTQYTNLGKKFLTNSLIFIVPFLLVSCLFYYYCRQIMRKRFSLAYALTRALKENQFYPSYQPVWDEAKARFCGAEILIRWNTDFDELIMPDYFIDEAEKCGLIVPMTLKLIETVFAECQSLLHTHKDLHLAFNVSPSHFKDGQFFNQFYELCQQYDIHSHQVMFELTEKELFSQYETEIIECMKQLREKGFALAVDDFGTGQANINYLNHFPFNYLKIDKVFIQTIGTGAVTEALNEGIINMANALGLEIIAEGVETKQQLDYLKANQVNFIQGWYYAKSMSFKEFSRLIKSS